MPSRPASKITDDVRRKIEVRAYLIWESEGWPHGREQEHWHRAEAEILAEQRRKAKPAAPKPAAAKAASSKASMKAAERIPAKPKTKSKRAAKPKSAKTAH